MASFSSYRYPKIGYATNNTGTSNTEYDEVYQDYNSMRVRTRSQDMEIQVLENRLKEKEDKKQLDLKNLIAYYYKK